MTPPNNPELQGPTDMTQDPPLRNAKPGSSAKLPRTSLVGGTAAAVAAVAILAISLSGCSDSSSSAGLISTTEMSAATTEQVPSFSPQIHNAEFGGWRDKKTNEIVTPPQRIKIVDSLDLTEKAESIGYGAAEQSMPKIAKYAATESSFPRNPAVNMLADADGDLRVFWACETMYNDPAGTNCHSYNLTVDISGSSPVVIDAAPNSPGPLTEAKTALSVDVQNMAVSNPEDLPASALGTDKGTGAPTVLVLGAVQPRENSAKVYFLVMDSLKLYVGELESSR